MNIDDRLYDKSDAYNDSWNKKIHIKLNILDDFLSLVSWQWNSAHDITTWHAGPSSTGFCGQFQHGRHGRPDPGVYQWCTMCFFSEKSHPVLSKAYIFNGGIWKNSIQFLRFTVRWKMPSGKSICIVSVQSTPISKSLQVFLFQRMVSCASSTSDSQTTCRRAPVACVEPLEAPDNIDIHGS